MEAQTIKIQKLEAQIENLTSGGGGGGKGNGNDADHDGGDDGNGGGDADRGLRRGGWLLKCAKLGNLVYYRNHNRARALVSTFWANETYRKVCAGV